MQPSFEQFLRWQQGLRRDQMGYAWGKSHGEDFGRRFLPQVPLPQVRSPLSQILRDMPRKRRK